MNLNNHNELLKQSKKFTRLDSAVEEIKEMKAKKFCVKRNIEALKHKLIQLLKEECK